MLDDDLQPHTIALLLQQLEGAAHQAGQAFERKAPTGAFEVPPKRR